MQAFSAYQFWLPLQLSLLTYTSSNKNNGFTFLALKISLNWISLSSVTAFALVEEYGVKENSLLEEQTLHLGAAEVLLLLKHTLLSKGPLTDVLLNNPEATTTSLSEPKTCSETHNNTSVLLDSKALSNINNTYVNQIKKYDKIQDAELVLQASYHPQFSTPRAMQKQQMRKKQVIVGDKQSNIVEMDPAASVEAVRLKAAVETLRGDIET